MRRLGGAWRAFVVGGVLLAAGSAAVLPRDEALGASATCQTSAAPAGTYTVKLCVTAPATGTTLTGESIARATITVPTGTSPGVARTEWSLGGQYILTDYQSPHEFTLYSADFADGTYQLSAVAVMRDGYTTPPTAVTVTLSNGNATAPVNTNQWSVPSIRARGPQEPFVVGAVGDGAGGELNAKYVSDALVGWNPDLFLYLGDVYSDGTLTEFRNWYGTPTTFFNRLRGVTAPVVGNHEYAGNQAPGYFHFWDNIPHYYSFDANGWHFVAIDSTSNYGRVAPGTAQYEWLAADLAANRSPCTMVFLHHPLYTVGSEEPASRMQPMWDLMAANRVTLLVTGHDHQYQRWSPMGAGGAVNAGGIVELVAGTGGHSSQAITSSDPRVAKTHRGYGALRMELFGDRADMRFHAVSATSTTLVDASTVTCKGSDGLPPTTPANPSAVADPAGPVQLSWTASTDNFGVTGYRVYRDGAVVADLPAGTTEWTDTSVAGATRYTYTLDAVDAAGNRSPQTPGVEVSTVGGDSTPPTVPGSVAATPSADAVTLTWAPSTDNVGVAGYEVRRDGTLLETVTSTGYSDTTVPADEPHSWTVAAVDAAGNTSAQSSPVTATRDTQPPSTPTDLATTGVAPNAVSLAWSPSTDNVGVTQYRVFRDGMYLAGTSGTDYTDTTPLGGTHSYQVLAVDAAGNLSPLSAPLEVQSVDGNPPTTAGDLSATAAPNAVTLSWAPATDDVGVTGYDVRRDGVVVGTTSQTSWTDHTVLSETTYTYTVVARDAAGNTSAPSASRTVSTPAPTPIVPIADTYARASNPTANYGRATTLRVDGDPVTNAYLKFTVPAGAGTVRRARLRVWVTAGTSSGVIVRTVGDSSWSETSLNWTNAPAIGSEPVAFSGRTTTGQWVTVDITPAVTTGTFTIALTSNGASSSSYGSRESATPPQLLLDVASG